MSELTKAQTTKEILESIESAHDLLVCKKLGTYNNTFSKAESDTITWVGRTAPKPIPAKMCDRMLLLDSLKRKGIDVLFDFLIKNNNPLK